MELNIRQDEIARELGVSKTTVSRALSGKGRIGKETRERILAYVENAKRQAEISVAESRATRNLGVVFPRDKYATGTTFFVECLLGICETAALLNYNVILTTATTQDTLEIQKLAEEKKVDGFILTRSQDGDSAIDYLLKNKIPVGITGTCSYEDVIQVDMDNVEAAERLVSTLVGMGYQSFALLLGSLDYHVDQDRYAGFWNAIEKHRLKKERQAFYTGFFEKDLLDPVIMDVMDKKIECIICGGAVLSERLVARMLAEGYRIPKDVAIASFSDNDSLQNLRPQVTAVRTSARNMGNTIGKQMIHFLQGKEYQKKTVADYEIMLRKSTSRG